jgi:hypothetical protein
MARMRVRVALGLAVLATVVGLAIDMSGSAPRGAGDDSVVPAAFYNVVPGGAVLCQGSMVLPGDAASLKMTIGTYGQRMPRIGVAFKALSGRTVATGVLAAGSVPQGVVAIPLRYPHGPSAAGTLCLHVGGSHQVAFGGEGFPTTISSVRVGGVVQAGRVSVVYRRRGRESWWQLLGILDQRFGLGKSSVFGDWTLPVLALVALVMWIAAVRLLVRELP